MNTEAIDNFASIKDDMLWKQSALDQIQEFKNLASRLGSRMEIVGSHTSKSIKLPVVRFEIDGRHFYLRDNFYDVNLCVIAVDPINVSLSEMFEGVYKPLTWEWYLAEIARCRGYSWREWSDTQMDDPQLLKLSPDAPSYLVKSQEEKDAWVKRPNDPTWYSTHWAAGKISWEGEFGPDAKLYIQQHPFMQGIEDLVPPRANKRYVPGASAFSISVYDFYKAELIINRVCKATKA